MPQLLMPIGTIAGALGVLICTISGLARISGFYYVASYQSTTLFGVGTGLMVFACLVKLEVLISKLDSA